MRPPTEALHRAGGAPLNSGVAAGAWLLDDSAAVSPGTPRVSSHQMLEEHESDPVAEDEGIPSEDRTGEPGAEGGPESPAADKLPGAPANDDSPLGDTDQHSAA